MVEREYRPAVGNIKPHDVPLAAKSAVAQQ